MVSAKNISGNGDGDFTPGDGDDSDDGNEDPYALAAVSNNITENNTDNNVFTLVFEDGLYSLSALQTALKRKLVALDSDLTGDEITLSPDNAQQKLVINVMPTIRTGDITLCFCRDIAL